MKNSLLLLLIILFGVLPVKAQWSIKGTNTDKNASWHLLQKFTIEEWEASNFATDEEMEWFTNARYGMFIHFGLSAYKEKDLSWGICETRKAPDQGSGPFPDSVWTKWPEHFKLEHFNAMEWVKLAQQTGMKYIVAVAKHHDGFHLWNTAWSDFNIMNTPFGRDYLKELADACHEADMKFGIYYSQRDWYHPDYAPIDPSLIEVTDKPPYYKAKRGFEKVRAGESHKEYIEYQFNVVKELCTNYGKVDIFWFDACWWGGMFTADMWESEKLTRMVRELQPGIIINNRASIPGDFDTPEQKIGMHQSRPWESCMSLCSSWSWSPTPIKSKKEIITMLTTAACGNGNMLLSWGPKWDGTFDPDQVKRLEEVGAWLESYGHTIYDTKGGPWYPERWGGCTFREHQVFVHILDQNVQHVALTNIQNKILSAVCITGGNVHFRQTEHGIFIDLANTHPNHESRIVALSFKDNILGTVDRVSK